MSVDRPPRASTPQITSQIRQAIFNWIHENGDGGLAPVADLYLEEEVHPNHRDALIELEDRYGIEQNRLLHEYIARLLPLGEQYAKNRRLGGVMRIGRPEDLVGYVPESERAEPFLHCLPEPELLTALEGYASKRPLVSVHGGEGSVWSYLERVFRTRGLPYTASAQEGIQLVGEPVLREHAIEPALSALADSRLSNARKEFEDARRELRNGQLDDAANDAGCAVESTMAALLHAHGRRQPTKHGKDRVQAGPLFDALEAAGVVDREGDRHLIFGAIDVRDAGSHGAGIAQRRTDRAYVEAGFTAAAIAITYLASKLPA